MNQEIKVIDWNKAEEKPEKKQTIKGRILINIKTKIISLEKEVEEKTKNLFQMEKDLDSMIEELKQTKSNNRAIFSEKEGIIRDLESQTENLRSNLDKKSDKVKELSDLLKEKESKILEVTTTSDQKISSMNSESKAAYNKISVLEGTINNIKIELTSKDVEIGENSLLNKELEEVKDKLNLELIEKTKSLAQKKFEINELQKELDEKNKEIETKSKHLQDLELELEVLKPLDIDTLTYSYDSRIKCPRCDSVGKYVQKVDDKNKVLSHIGSIPMYAKKYVCKKCTYEWI